MINHICYTYRTISSIMKKILSVILLALSVTLCQAQNPNITKLGNNNYKIRILPDNFRYERAQANNWAACMSMVLNNSGLSVSQADAATLGSGVINAATPDTWGRAAHVFVDEANSNEDTFFDELSANRPLIVMLRSGNSDGKTNLVVAMTYSIMFDEKGNQTGITPSTVTLVDPGVGAQSQKVMTWGDFMTNVSVLYSTKVSFK